MKKSFILGLFLILFQAATFAANDSKENTYLTPARLFHIARSANRNLVCYDVNVESGKLNTKEPLKVYWVDREKHPGRTEPLNYIQRKLAYGYKLVEARDSESVCSLTAYPSR